MAFPESALDVQLGLYLLGSVRNATARLIDNDTITIAHGRQNENSRANPATVTFNLDNRDGVLTPNDPRATYWPDMVVGMPVLVQAYGAGFVFYGKATELTPSWPFGAAPSDNGRPEAFLTVTASGVLRRVGRKARPLRSAIRRLATNPTNVTHLSDYWPMEDGADAAFGASGLPAVPGVIYPKMSYIALTKASDSTLAGSDPLPTVPFGQDGAWSAAPIGIDGHWVVEQVIRVPVAPAAAEEEIFLEVITDGYPKIWQLRMGWDGTDPFLRFRGYSPTGAIVIDDLTTSPPDLFVDLWVTIRIEIEQSGANLDWTYQWSTISPDADVVHGATSTLVSPSADAGRPTLVRAEINQAPGGGVSSGHVMVHDGIAPGWLIPADIGHAGEEARDRIARLCAEEGVTASFVTSTDPGIGTSSMPMGPQKSGAFLALLEECADADMGILCEERDTYGLVYRTRGSRYNKTVDLVLDASLSDIAVPFAPTADDQQTRNDVEVQRKDGTKGRVTDEDHIAAHDDEVYDYTTTLNLHEDDLVIHAAGWLLHLGTYEGNRYASLTIDLAVRPELIAAWKTLVVGSRIQVVNLPTQHPIWPDVDLILEGWSETLGPHSWTVTANCSPALPWDVATWDESRYDSRGSTLSSSVDPTTTTMSIATTGEPGSLWSTTAEPYDLLIDGELVTVTTMTGASSPQTATVTRSVNGIVRSHAAGVSVHLHPSPVLAL